MRSAAPKWKFKYFCSLWNGNCIHKTPKWLTNTQSIPWSIRFEGSTDRKVSAPQMKILPFVIVKMRFPSQLTRLHWIYETIEYIFKWNSFDFFSVFVRPTARTREDGGGGGLGPLCFRGSDAFHSSVNKCFYKNSFILMDWSYIIDLHSKCGWNR